MQRVKLPRGKIRRLIKLKIISEDEGDDEECKNNDASGSDICLVCGDFGKNGELW